MKNSLLILLVAGALGAFTLPAKRPSAERTERKERITVTGGIKFAKIRVEKAMEEAKASGKLIFIDVHTTWCGPCKEMARTTFQSDEVGKVFNKKFVNLKIDAENDPD